MSYDDSASQLKKDLPKQELTGLQKAAVVLMALEKDQVTEVLSFMDKHEIKTISRAILSLIKLPTETIEDILRQANKQLYDTAILMQNFDNTKHVLESILGEGQFEDIVSNLRDSNSSTWTKLSQIDNEILSSYLQNEHPQTIALVISKLDPTTSAKILSLLPEKLSLDVLMRIPKMDSVKRELLYSIENTLKDEFISGEFNVVKTDYKKLVANIFNCFDRNTEVKFMKMVEEQDKNMAEYIQDYMFTFDHLIKLDNASVQRLLRSLEKDKLALALKGSSQEIKDLFFKNMSERAAHIMQDDMASMGPVRVKDVDEAQSYIIKVTKDLINSGEVTISEGKDDELIY